LKDKEQLKTIIKGANVNGGIGVRLNARSR
jgi:hypothetical protein